MQTFRYWWMLPVALWTVPRSVQSFSFQLGAVSFSTSTKLAMQVQEEVGNDGEDDYVAEFMTVSNSDLANEYSTTYHAPVMWSECIQALLQCERARANTQGSNDRPLIFVDGTLGGGGHSAALLERLGPGDILLGCDIDPNALQTASSRLDCYMNHHGTEKPHFIPVQTNFGELSKTLPKVLHPVTNEPMIPTILDDTVTKKNPTKHTSTGPSSRA